MSKSWYSIAARADGVCELSIYDEIGIFGVTAKSFRDEFLAQVKADQDVVLRVNSPGGSVFDGYAIYNILDRHKGRVDVFVDGIAASAASYIAMAGDSLTMPENSFLMIHDPMTLVAGNAEEMRQVADFLDKITATYVTAYMKKSGRDASEIEAAMADETWFTAQEAVSFGFADETAEEVKVAANFDLARFNSAPSIFSQKQPNQLVRASDSTPPSNNGGPMTTETEAREAGKTEGFEAGRQSVLAVLALQEAIGREAVAMELAQAGVDATAAKIALAAVPIPEASEEPEVAPKADVDVDAVASAAAKAAVASMMEGASGTGLAEASEPKGGAEKFVAARA